MSTGEYWSLLESTIVYQNKMKAIGVYFSLIRPLGAVAARRVKKWEGRVKKKLKTLS